MIGVVCESGRLLDGAVMHTSCVMMFVPWLYLIAEGGCLHSDPERYYPNR